MRQRYPSDKRSADYNREYRLRHKHPCLDCGKPCDKRSQRCKSCSIKANWQKDGSLRAFASLRGENHHSWKGGRYKDSRGYVYIYQPDYPRANKGSYVLEHILVWEETHGKPLPEGWVVHHLNGIKDDNRPKNLEGLPNKKHFFLLQAKTKRIQELEALLNNQYQLL